MAKSRLHINSTKQTSASVWFNNNNWKEEVTNLRGELWGRHEEFDRVKERVEIMEISIGNLCTHTWNSQKYKLHNNNNNTN